MKPPNKKETQLLQEIRDLRRQVAVLQEAELEHQQTEEGLRQARNFLRSVIEAIPEVTLVVDRDFRIVLANRAARDRIGGDDPVSSGLKCYQVSRHRETPCDGKVEPCPLARVLETKTPVTVTHTHYDAEGNAAIVEVSAAPIFDEQGEVVRIIESCCDVTQLRQAQEKLVQAERLAAIGEAITGLAHESRNALQRSQACLEMLARRVEDRPDVRELMERIQASQDHLHRLYERVREYAAPLVLRPEQHDVRHLVREAWDSLVGYRAGRAVVLTERAAEADTLCQVDGLALQEVFRNVLENALDACPDPVRIEVQYSAAEVDGRPAIQIALRDNGPGLSPEQRRRLFDSFFTTKTHGTGLGLSIAKRLVEAHAGWIGAGSASGPGAEIVIQLPRSPR
jgi:PAS domain S-box-containing protein